MNSIVVGIFPEMIKMEMMPMMNVQSTAMAGLFLKKQNAPGRALDDVSKRFRIQFVQIMVPTDKMRDNQNQEDVMSKQVR